MSFIVRSRLVRYIGITVISVIVLIIAGGGWYFAGVLEADGLRIDNSPREFRFSIASFGDDTITLQQLDSADPDDKLSTPAIWGVTNGDDYGQVGDVLSNTGGLVTRKYELMVGDLLVGEPVYFDRTSYPHDPLSAHGLDYQEILISGPLGNLPTWYIAPTVTVPESFDVWAVLVHGRTANRDSSIPILDNLAELGIPSLTITYRNDEGAPPSKSGYYDFGVTEWADVEAATRYAFDNGAKKIILFGDSMGGGIVVNYQLQSILASRTAGLILDSPMLNFGRTVDKGAEERSVPAPITAAAKLWSSLRFGINWGAMDFLSHADELTVPVLLIHGDGDDTVPIETSLEFAEQAPGITELHTFPDAGHVQSWNYFRDEYESIVENFIERVR